MNDDPALDAIATLVPALLQAMDALENIARRMQPGRLAALLAAAGPRDTTLRDAIELCRATPWPEPLAALREHLVSAGDAALLAFDGLRTAAASAEGARDAYRALRHANRAEAALYPVAAVVPVVSRLFLEPEGAATRCGQLAQADPTRSDVGVMHSGETPGERGGFSLYVPEDYDASRACPLVMALHGGSGNGGAFLWSWLRSARTRGAVLVAPTATGATWSLREPEHDSANIEHILAHVRQRWNVDPSRLLLSGMSDGGTFALLSGLADTSPFTHLAPAATGFHPMLLEMTEPARLAGLPIYLIHGTLDWMFDVGRARGVARALTSAGADVLYREVDDLSHVYPRDENPRMVEWLDGKHGAG